MSDASEKPFEPTPQRLARAKREGDVARAGEFGANVAFAGAVAAVAAVAPHIGTIARDAVRRAAAGENALAQSAALFALACVPAAAGALTACAASAVQNGGLRAVAVAAKPERLDPREGLRRIFSRDSVWHAARAALAFVVAFAAMLPVFAGAASEALRAGGVSTVAAATWQAALRAAAVACGTGALFAIGEFASARAAWHKKLRMTLDERKREAKEQEGDPHARGRRRALHRSLLRGGIARVRDAAFVVANPTHVAIALEYAPPAVAVPRVLVRAEGSAAFEVRRIVAAAGIPIVENVALARALYRDARAGEAIPHAHYVAVAEIVAALLRSGAPAT